MSLRDQAREALELYRGRTGLSVGHIALRMGYARNSLLQFSSNGKYSEGDGDKAAHAVLEYIKALGPLAALFFGPWIAMRVYYRQKEYETTKQGYLEGGLDVIAGQLHATLAL